MQLRRHYANTTRGDNVVAARLLGFEHVVDYVTLHHAVVSLPVLLLMDLHTIFGKSIWISAKVHPHLLKLMKVNSKVIKNYPAYYALFPLVPLILIIVLGLCFREIKVGLVEITLFSFILAFATELIRKGNPKEQMVQAGLFLKAWVKAFLKLLF
ncbi:hypothetical protein J4731_02835 [Providencia rettgeri]|nr:hypothetical protein [Providencia rettgeri]